MNKSSNGPPKIVGKIDEKVVQLLGISDTLINKPIYLGVSNIEHMKKDHPEDFEKYFSELESILQQPDFVSLHPKNKSIQYIKVFESHIMVAVRVSRSGKIFTRTIFEMSETKVKAYKERNALIKY